MSETGLFADCTLRSLKLGAIMMMMNDYSGDDDDDDVGGGGYGSK